MGINGRCNTLHECNSALQRVVGAIDTHELLVSSRHPISWVLIADAIHYKSATVCCSVLQAPSTPTSFLQAVSTKSLVAHWHPSLVTHTLVPFSCHTHWHPSHVTQQLHTGTPLLSRTISCHTLASLSHAGTPCLARERKGLMKEAPPSVFFGDRNILQHTDMCCCVLQSQ